MESIGAYEAKTNLAKLLERVLKGEQFTITKHGVPVAVLQPPISARKVRPKKVIDEIRMFREKNILGSDTIRSMIEEGRR
jgi:prevent-host-death family protein